MLSQPLAHIVSRFILDGETYEVERFKMSFSQSVDYKGQPQHEVRGGQLFVTLNHIANNSLYLWAKKSTQLKSGVILFQTDLGMTILKVEFINAYTGTTTSLIISPEKVKLNGVEHQNYWKNG